ncbi:cytochrome P450 [Mycena crocata]|nr:cytochrome P450 [Mycena crocata]
MDSLSLSLCVILLATCVYFRYSVGCPLPPGPPKYPLIGNALSIPRSHPWVAFSEWAKEFGSDIIHLNVFGTSIVVLDSYNAVTELLGKRSSMYSHRPSFVMATELMGWETSVFFQHYGEDSRAARRLLHDQFQPTAATRFRPQQVASSQSLLMALLDYPENFSEHIRHTTGSFSMSIAYGLNVLPASDPLIGLAETTLIAAVVAATPGSFFVDFLPMLKHVPTWMPGAGFRRHAQKWKQDRAVMIDRPFLATKRALAEGHAPPSFTRYGLESMASQPDTANYEQLIKHTAADIYVGVTDSTAASIQSFFLGMLANPEAMRAAQAEIDAVVKPGFLPSFDDEESLPYVSAIVKETLRWNNATPIAIPHAVTKDDTYRGYRIPAGSLVISNLWSIAHDETEYPDAFKFMPERFLKNGAINSDVRDPRTFIFGAGRRSCPGLHVAYSFLWIVVASVLCCFDIDKLVDEEGEIVEPSYAYSSGLLSLPEPFKCSITSRSELKAQLIRHAVEAR